MILARFHGAFIYNVQEIHPDAACIGLLRNRWRFAWLMTWSVYRKAAIVSVISERMRQRLLQEIAGSKGRLIPTVDVRLSTTPEGQSIPHGLQTKFGELRGQYGKPQHLRR